MLLFAKIIKHLVSVGRCGWWAHVVASLSSGIPCPCPVPVGNWKQPTGYSLKRGQWLMKLDAVEHSVCEHVSLISLYIHLRVW